MSRREVDYLLIGGGPASASCAEHLRSIGGQGSILIVGRELDPPYDRTTCSKGYLRGGQRREEVHLHPSQWWEDHDVQILTASATAIDVKGRTVRLSTREEISFGQALVATGSNVRRLNVDGCQLDQIHYLRTLGNADAIRNDLQEAERVVLIGGSYIGCEVAATLTASGKTCEIVMEEQFALERSFGQRIGRHFTELLGSHGVTIHEGDQLAGFQGDGRVRRVLTRAGLELDADVVVIGAGVTPEVRLAATAGLTIGELGGVRCDSRLESSVDQIFAAGDVCEYDSPVHGGRPIRVEHWQAAVDQGETVARNMLGRRVDHRAVPYFFSDLSDWASLEYVGPARRWDEEIVRGSLGEGRFTNWYLSEGRVVGALTVGRSSDLDLARELMVAGIAEPLDDDRRAALADGEQ